MPLGWPVSLPQNLLVGVTSEDNDETTQKPTSTGPRIVRLRDTVEYSTHSGELILTRAQLATFRSFYSQDHLKGAEPFEWTDPYTEVAKYFRIVAKPQYTDIGAGYTRVTLVLEEVPS